MPTHYKGKPEEELALDTFIKFTRASDALNARLTRGGSLEGLTGSQFGALEALYHLGPLCPGEIGEKILRSSGNMTLVIDNLERDGLVRRERDQEDRRQINVHLTEEGRTRIAEVLPAQVEAIVEAFDSLTPEEQQMLGVLCRLV